MPRSLPPLYALRAFEAAARHSSFTRAAEELSITQSAVSRHIRTLEEHLACRLFQRSGRNIQLTEAARALLPGIREGFLALERACGGPAVEALAFLEEGEVAQINVQEALNAERTPFFSESKLEEEEAVEADEREELIVDEL